MKKFLLLLACFLPLAIHAQYVTVYYIDKYDDVLNDVKPEIKPQSELNVDYSTLVIVYDSKLDKMIGAWGTHQTFHPTKENFRKIIINAERDYKRGVVKIRSSDLNTHFDGILGLTWGMPLTDALAHLRTMTLTEVEQGDGDYLYIPSNVYLDGVRYDVMYLEYYVTNKQVKILTGLKFARFCKQAQEAKDLREEIAGNLIMQFGFQNVKDEIDSNGFKSYFVNKREGEGEYWYEAPRVRLDIVKADGIYGVRLNYLGILAQFKTSVESQS